MRTNTSRANARRRCTRSGAWLRAYAANQAGVSALEYAIMAGLIVLAVASIAGSISGTISTAFNHVAAQVATSS